MAASGGFRGARECDSNDASGLILAVGYGVYTINCEKSFKNSCCFSGLESK